jgi:hypothetical protein
MKLRPVGIEYLSGPPIGSMEYMLLPELVRHGFLRSITREANGHKRTRKYHEERVVPTQEQKKRQHGHAA